MVWASYCDMSGNLEALHPVVGSSLETVKNLQGL